MPQKFDSMIGEGGVNLSGGQRQALTLMMATINPPKLLLLDEHTAALDPATAAKVLDLTEQLVTVFHEKLTPHILVDARDTRKVTERVSGIINKMFILLTSHKGNGNTVCQLA